MCVTQSVRQGSTHFFPLQSANTTLCNIMASIRQAMALRDTTNAANVDDRKQMLWGSALKPSPSRVGGILADVTPKAIRPTSSMGTPLSGAANGLTETPGSRRAAAISTPQSTVKVLPFNITPQRPLFQSPRRYLLADREVGDAPVLTVVWDLDETLVSNRNVNLSQAILRPYALHVLNALRHMKGLEVVLWTASTEETGAPVVDQLYSGGQVFDDVIFRNDSWFTEPIHTKDLRLLGRDMDRVVVFDNAPNCCKLNPTNSVLVDDFMGARNENDAALINCYYIIEALLKMARQGVSVRDGLAKLMSEANLCRPVYFQLPENWARVNMRDVAPIRIPPHGKYIRAHTTFANEPTMKHWTM
ncbi:Hypothetical protein, putative [Bodo saltans]|uniref:Mitochondrial import inner membrane translocase subunit TIM50 n=1 Tax=Bodo saltans TaxID=75058 RepID=A0A0S4ILH7_BODSA|nr:Hypothetical protein, putative [Bodo saltans]|eukprot:CUE71404.1 Hypothetical protein, putative [Bodo saltans]